jgi:hypothetical protein
MVAYCSTRRLGGVRAGESGLRCALIGLRKRVRIAAGLEEDDLKECIMEQTGRWRFGKLPARRVRSTIQDGVAGGARLMLLLLVILAVAGQAQDYEYTTNNGSITITKWLYDGSCGWVAGSLGG